MATLYIIRGVPGTGKSTSARNYAHVSGAEHFEADMYFMKEGEYKFDASKLKQAHGWCFSQTQYNLMKGKDVIVSNTFTKYNEMVNYVKMAKSIGVEINVITMTKEYGSIHNVPEEKMVQMRARFESHESIMEKVEKE